MFWQVRKANVNVMKEKGVLLDSLVHQAFLVHWGSLGKKEKVEIKDNMGFLALLVQKYSIYKINF